MAEENIVPARYGNIWVDGSATAHLGDFNVVNYVFVENALLADHTDSLRIANRTSLPNLISRKRSCENEGLHIFKKPRWGPDHERVGYHTAAHEPLKGSQTLRALPEAEAVAPSMPFANSQRTSAVHFLYRLFAGLAVSLRLPIRLSTPNILPQEETEMSTSMDIASSSASLQPRYPHSRDLILLSLLLASFLTGRNVSSDEVSKFTLRCYQDNLMPVFAFVFGMALYRQLYLGNLSGSHIGIGADHILLEDAFGIQRQISMSVCTHFSVLKAFLKVHYQGGLGEHLVDAEQFNLMLNSRRGQLIRTDDWSQENRIRPNARVIMSFFFMTDTAVCSSCNSELAVNNLGEFCCAACNSFYRDCCAMNYLYEAIEQRKAEKQLEQRLASHGARQIREDYRAMRSTFELSGFRHIDLHLFPVVDTSLGDPASSSSDDAASSSSDDAYNLDIKHAVSYVNKVKYFFREQPEIYEEFLTILKAYQQDSLPPQQVSSQIITLLASAPDLVKGFMHFLPKTSVD